MSTLYHNVSATASAIRLRSRVRIPFTLRASKLHHSGASHHRFHAQRRRTTTTTTTTTIATTKTKTKKTGTFSLHMQEQVLGTRAVTLCIPSPHEPDQNAAGQWTSQTAVNMLGRSVK